MNNLSRRPLGLGKLFDFEEVEIYIGYHDTHWDVIRLCLLTNCDRKFPLFEGQLRTTDIKKRLPNTQDVHQDNFHSTKIQSARRHTRI